MYTVSNQYGRKLAVVQSKEQAMDKAANWLELDKSQPWIRISGVGKVLVIRRGSNG